jgi:hypothetical protein
VREREIKSKHLSSLYVLSLETYIYILYARFHVYICFKSFNES